MIYRPGKKTSAAPAAVTPQVKSVAMNACMTGLNCCMKSIIKIVFPGVLLLCDSLWWPVLRMRKSDSNYVKKCILVYLFIPNIPVLAPKMKRVGG